MRGIMLKYWIIYCLTFDNFVEMINFWLSDSEELNKIQGVTVLGNTSLSNWSTMSFLNIVISGINYFHTETNYLNQPHKKHLIVVKPCKKKGPIAFVRRQWLIVGWINILSLILSPKNIVIGYFMVLELPKRLF